jgi:transcriptional regulator with XRE-family HTH domain
MFCMAKRPLTAEHIPTIVNERLTTWGATVRKQRVSQKITAADLCSRMQISFTTLQRLERGSGSVSGAHYLTALLILGVFERVTPSVDPRLWQTELVFPRARPSRQDEEYF